MLIITNPASANGATGLRWSGVEARLRSEGLTFDVALTEAPGHATELAEQAAADGEDAVICAGGDGTLNEIVNGLMHADVDTNVAQRPALGVIPSGTGTDFARGLNLPKDLDGIAAMLKRRATQPIDVGLASFMRAGQPVERHFINIAGLGFDGEVSDVVNREGKRGGSLAYFVNVFKVLARYENKRARVTLISDDGERAFEGEFNMIAVCNGRYFGGGMLVSPNADVRDGLFDVIVIEAMSRGEFALAFPRVYRGTHLSHPKVKTYRARDVQVRPITPSDANQRIFLEAEGELFGEAPASFRLLPGALRVMTHES
jgi:YegS/Rv2252/BmrU family lipid kinase